jgi:prepilin-type N-terminal cleavage/methylation domain-containing protein
MREFVKQFHYGEKGFTLIELLVVVAILGVLAAVAVPSLGRYMGKGKTESYATELHNIQTATMAMLADSSAGELDAAYTTPTGDMSDIQADGGDLTLSSYPTGLAGSSVKSGCTYTFSKDGKVVTQILP